MAEFKDLEVWQLGRELVKLAYQVANKLPSHEQWLLTCDIKKVAIAVPTDIARAIAPGDEVTYNHRLEDVLGKLGVLETYLTLACDQGYFSEGEIREIESAIKHLQQKHREFIAPLKAAYNVRQQEMYKRMAANVARAKPAAEAEPSTETKSTQQPPTENQQYGS